VAYLLCTLHNNILKLTAQLYELPPGADRTVRLEIKQNGAWTQIDEAQVSAPSWVALFRVENWDSSQDHGTASPTAIVLSMPV
jgi:hypothetical protein